MGTQALAAVGTQALAAVGTPALVAVGTLGLAGVDTPAPADTPAADSSVVHSSVVHSSVVDSPVVLPDRPRSYLLIRQSSQWYRRYQSDNEVADCIAQMHPCSRNSQQYPIDHPRTCGPL